METRTITEYKLYLLYLNNMRGPCEAYECVAIASSHNALLSYYNSMLEAKPYEDSNNEIADNYGQYHSYNKFFKKGSPLEWYNPDFKIRDMWIRQDKLSEFKSKYRFLG